MLFWFFLPAHKALRSGSSCLDSSVCLPLCRAKGWFTYKRDNDNSNFVPVVLCAAENGRGGLEEVSPAHFEVHRAQCAQKKWRQSFKVLGEGVTRSETLLGGAQR